MEKLKNEPRIQDKERKIPEWIVTLKTILDKLEVKKY